jgi:penicillin-binding protein 2
MVDIPTKRTYPALYVGLVIMLVLLTAQLFNMQILQGSAYQERAKGNREREMTAKASRGVIYDRNGARLVANNPTYSVAVTPAELPDVDCAVGNLDGSAVFAQLADTLNITNVFTISDVIAIRPLELPLERKVEIANRLSVPLQVNKNIIVAAIDDVLKDTPQSKNLFVIRRDVPRAASDVLKKDLTSLPGVKIYNELEYNFITRFQSCLKPITVKRSVPYEVMLKVETQLNNMAGVQVVSEPVRAYTSGPYFSHLLGYVGPISREDYEKNPNNYEPDDKVGQLGLEAALEDQLRGVKGKSLVVVNSSEQMVSEIASQPPVTGNNVSLTLDAALQISATRILQEGLSKAKVSAGVAIVERVDNGQILAMVSLPSYDNNLFSMGISQADFDLLNTDPNKPMFNRSVAGAYPPGSTYKMITASAALQEGVVRPDTTFFCPGYIEVPYTYNERQRNRYRDWRAGGHGTINVIDALKVSSDVFFYIASGPRQEDSKRKLDDGTELITWTRYYTPGSTKPTEFNGLGIARLHNYVQAFGLGAKSGIELPGEVSGLAPDQAWKISTYPDNPWSLGDTLVSAIGQGYDLATPLQMVNATAAVANGGILYQPQLVLNVTDPSGKVVKDYQSKVIRQLPVAPENLAIVREGMRQVVADKKGTAANRITLKSIQVAGKTGTAEYGEPIGKKDGKDVRRSHAWFTAYAPADKPEIAVVVLLEGGQESLEGSTFAVPVADEILKAYFHVDK